MKAEKYEFHSDSVEYLGYVLSLSSLTMSDAKVKTIQEWPEPKKVKDIQSFLGFANFYRHFIFNYSDIVIPLTRLTRKNTPWNLYRDIIPGQTSATTYRSSVSLALPV